MNAVGPTQAREGPGRGSSGVRRGVSGDFLLRIFFLRLRRLPVLAGSFPSVSLTQDYHSYSRRWVGAGYRVSSASVRALQLQLHIAITKAYAHG